MNTPPRRRAVLPMMAAMVATICATTGVPERETTDEEVEDYKRRHAGPTSTRVDVDGPPPGPQPAHAPSPRHAAIQRASRVACATEAAAQAKRARKAARRLAEAEKKR